jgi:hypothetical protein
MRFRRMCVNNDFSEFVTVYFYLLKRPFFAPAVNRGVGRYSEPT